MGALEGLMGALSVADRIQLAIATTTAIAAYCAFLSARTQRQALREQLSVTAQQEAMAFIREYYQAAKKEAGLWYLLIAARQILEAYPGNPDWVSLVKEDILGESIEEFREWNRDGYNFKRFGPVAKIVEELIQEREVKFKRR